MTASGHDVGPDVEPDPDRVEVRVARFDGFDGPAGPARPVADLGAAADPAATSPSTDLTGLGAAAQDGAPVASFAPGRAATGDPDGADAPVASFDAGPPTGARVDAPVAELGTGAARRAGRGPGGASRPRTPAAGTARARGAREPVTEDPGDVPGRDGGEPDRRRPGDRTAGDRARPRPERRVDSPAQLDPDADPVAAARAVCLRLLTDRARTRQELAQALRRKGVPDEAAGTVLERFDEVGLIDDAAFADQWVRSRHTYRGLGRRAIAVELRRKGVADDVAGEALAGVDTEAEERRARELVERKLRSLPVSSAEHRAVAVRRLVGMLARKGYGGGVAYRVVREALAAHGAELDELGDTEPDED